MGRLVTMAVGIAMLVGCGAVGPDSGTWLYEEVQVAEDTCNADGEISDPDGEFYIRNNGDGTFTIDPNDGTDIFSCTLSGASFDCPSRLVEEVEDATVGIALDVQGVAVGKIANSKRASGSQTGDVTCAGAGCGLIEGVFGTTFPCTVTWDFDITWLGSDQGPELE